MKEAIIFRSIAELQREGLRFSLDEVARSLKISKKTIYKYFSTKEELAIAIYKTFYDDAAAQTDVVARVPIDKNIAAKALTVYFQSHCMVRNDVFNKYSLNENIRALAIENHNKIRARIENLLPTENRTALMVIVDGSLQKLGENRECAEEVIERLVSLICWSKC